VRPIPSRLLIVTDRHQCQRSLEDVVQEVASNGAKWFWLRDRDMDSTDRYKLAIRLRSIIGKTGGYLSVGADIDLARKLVIAAVHLRLVYEVERARRILGRETLVGLSAHSVADVVNAKTAGADYVTLSPIYPTASKLGYGPCVGTAAIEAAQNVGIPVIALGGVNMDNAPLCIEAGAAGVAVMGKIMRSPDPAMIVSRFLSIVSRDVRAI
jgi:thiamine-phosphate pyrophosphorylase